MSLKKKFHNQFILRGNKHNSEIFFFKNLKRLQKKDKKNHKSVLKFAIKNVSPIIKIRQIKKKRRKNIKEFAYIVNKNNRLFFGIKHVLAKIHKKKLTRNLFEAFVDFSKKKDDLIKIKKADIKLALSLKKYLFYRWFC